MPETYVVSVQRIVKVTDPETGREIDRDYATVLNFEAPAEALLRFAPAEVAAALGAQRAAVTVHPERREALDSPETSSTPQDVDETLPPADQSPAAVGTKRKRRTKLEKAADDEAQALGYRDAAHRAEVEAAPAGNDGEGPTGDGDADLAVAEQAAGAPSVLATPVPQPPAPMPAGTATTPAQPAHWNPFEQQ